MGRSNSAAAAERLAISRRKPATRSCAGLISSMMCSCARCSSAAVHRPELAGDVVVARGEADQRAALDDQDLAVGYRFGGEGVLLADLQAEHVTGEIEGADLAAAVIEDLVGADGAVQHFVDGFRRLR